MINSQGGWDGKGNRPARPEDFFSTLAPPEQTAEDMLAAIEAWTSVLGGDDLTTGT